MASTLTKILLHITFSTKDRANLIPQFLHEELIAYIGGICRTKDCMLLCGGGTENHVHLFVSLAKTIALADLMMEIKRDSSKWLKRRDAGLADFHWQEGYFAFSIGVSGADRLREYIAHQAEHHRTIDFQTEVRRFLERYGVEFDERYIWS